MLISNGERTILPVAVLTPGGLRFLGHFDLPKSETINPITGKAVDLIAPEDVPALLRMLTHEAPEDSGTYHRPPPEGYTFRNNTTGETHRG